VVDVEMVDVAGVGLVVLEEDDDAGDDVSVGEFVVDVASCGWVWCGLP
jgi:hypothetical protein